MTTDDILRMAREAGVSNASMTVSLLGVLERFFRLAYAAGAAAEREQCAEVAKAISDKYAVGHYGNEVDTADEIEDAIRARGKT